MKGTNHLAASAATTLLLLGSAAMGLLTSGNGIDTVVFSMYDWTRTQKGVGV